MILNLIGLLVDILTPTIEWLNVKTINFPSPFWYPFSEQYSFQVILLWCSVRFWGGHSCSEQEITWGFFTKLGQFWVPVFYRRWSSPGMLSGYHQQQWACRRVPVVLNGGQTRLELGSRRRAHWKPMKPFNFVCCLVEIVAYHCCLFQSTQIHLKTCGQSFIYPPAIKCGNGKSTICR